MSNRLILSVAIVFAVSVNFARAETEKIGPVNVVVRVNSVDVPLTVNSLLDVNSKRGDFNANGEIVLSSPGRQLADKLVLIVTHMLPVEIAKLPANCAITLDKISKIDLASQDYEARVHVEGDMTLRCAGNHPGAVTIDAAILAAPTTGNRLKWKILRTPVCDMPWAWKRAINITQFEATNNFCRTQLQAFLDSNFYPMPNLNGVQASFQGANFDGNTESVSFRVKGDVHADGKNLTAVAVPLLLKNINLDFTIPAQKK